LVEYPDLPDKLSNIIELKKFVDDFEYKQLSISDYKGAESNEGVRVVFRSSDSSYDQLRNEIFWGKFDTDLILILDGKPDTFDDVKKDEVATLVHLFEHSTHTLTIEIDEIDEDLSFRDDFSVILRNHWGSNSFRDINFYKNPAVGNRVHNVSQGAVIEEIVTQSEYAHKGDVFKDLFLTAPTGAGKSVLFQIPAIFLAEKYNAVTIVVSPLKALMKDQIEGLKSRGIFNAAFINSDISLVERNSIIDDINEGKISILYLSPELLLSYHLEHFIGNRKLGLLVVDEAHLVTTWGRDFRVDYWFLGNYIKKLRKYHSSKFPVLAVTATAVYGGPDDLVFETVESLNMQMRRLFIGNIRREDISFEVNQIEYESSYEIERKQKTIDQIAQFIRDGTKAIVYFPWTSQIREIQLSLPEEHRDKVRMYYGNVSKEERAEVLEGFRDGDLKVVLATKAFGMGVDISDIEVVYHHAPSGNLSDYVQEIGRVARKSEIDGLAKVDFSSKDLKYTKILYGLSAIRQWHVYGVLEKLFRVFRLKKKRNFLVSVEDFKHIFSDQMTDDAIEQK
jgi:RecQ family ATP-dependent DNA helicase